MPRPITQAPTMQQPSTLTVRHAEAGAPIEAVVRIAGRLEIVPISDRHALELISDLAAGLARNSIETQRREETAMPKHGNRPW